MKMTNGKWIIIAMFLMVATLSVRSIPETAQKEGKNTQMDKNHIVLLGASVGRAWEIQSYPERMKDPQHTFESIACYQYDKTECLEEILMRPKRKFRMTRTYVKGFFQPAPRLPGTIIIKECAAYFPGDMHEYQEMVKQWIKRIREANIEVVLATTVPITRTRVGAERGQMEQILEFNDWMRSYAVSEHVRLLDLEVALKRDAKDLYLQDALSTDGLHLNKKAYDILDKVLQNSLQTDL